MGKLIKLLIILIFSMIFSGCLGMHYNTGESYLKQEKYPEAISAFKTVLEQNPEYSDAHTQLGIAYYRTGMYEQAISELKAAKELRISDKRARLFLGMAYLKYGKTEDAIDDTIVEWDSYLDMFPFDNMSDILQKSVTVLKSGETLPATVDLMTSSIETAIAQEDKDRDAIYSDRYRYRYRNFGYRHHSFRRGCD